MELRRDLRDEGVVRKANIGKSKCGWVLMQVKVEVKEIAAR